MSCSSSKCNYKYTYNGLHFTPHQPHNNKNNKREEKHHICSERA